MNTFIAMIRGVNVVGANMLKMERLRALISECGFDNVRTYIQSGNVIFSAKASAAKCAATIESKLTAELGKPISALVRTPAELAAIIAANPFSKVKKLDGARLAVAFLSEAPEPKRHKALAAIDLGRDQYRLRGAELFLYCPDGFGRSKLSKTFERVIGVRGTARNWNTVKKLHELSIIHL